MNHHLKNCPYCGRNDGEHDPSFPHPRMGQFGISESLRIALNDLRKTLQMSTPSIDQIHESGADGPLEEAWQIFYDNVLPHLHRAPAPTSEPGARGDCQHCGSRRPLHLLTCPVAVKGMAQGARKEAPEPLRQLLVDFSNNTYHCGLHLADDEKYAEYLAAATTAEQKLIALFESRATPASPAVPQQPVSEQIARDCIDGAIARGRLGIDQPPAADHWLMEYWQIGRQLAKLGETSAWDNVTSTVSSPAPVAPSEPVSYQSRLIGPNGHSSSWSECDARIYTRFRESGDIGDGFHYEVRALVVVDEAKQVVAGKVEACDFCDGAGGWGSGEDADGCTKCHGSGQAQGAAE